MARRALPPDATRLLVRTALAPADRHVARRILCAFEPPSPEQARERDRIVAFLDTHADALHRTCLSGHLTASALVLDAAGERCLLTHHRKLGRWLQLGGHCDGDGNLPGVALREAVEESGIPDLAIDPRPVDVDVHPIPARAGEPEHLHLDTRFLVWAPRGARAIASEESNELAWFALDDVRERVGDESVLRLIGRLAAGP